MRVAVEFYGVPRQRSGVHRAVVEQAAETVRLGDVLRCLAEQFPQFGRECLEPTTGLRPAYIANINGERFVTDPNAALQDGEALLIMSADAGG
jgi:molybdopterin converting factor small subunit